MLLDQANSMRVIHTLPGDSNYVVALRFAVGGTRLISGAMGGALTLWDTRHWTVRKAVSGHTKSVNVMALDQTGDRLATGSSDCDVCIWSLPDFARLHRLRDRKQVVSAMAASHAGTCFAIGSYGGRVAVWDFAGQPLCGFRAQARHLAMVAFAPDDSALLTGGLGGAWASWSLPDAVQTGSMAAHDVAVTFGQYLPDAGQILTLGYDGILKLWDMHNWALVRSQLLCDERITSFQLDATGTHALVLTPGLIRIFSLADWTYVDACAVDSKILPCGAFAPDGRSAVVAAADGRVRVLTLD